MCTMACWQKFGGGRIPTDWLWRYVICRSKACRSGHSNSCYHLIVWIVRVKWKRISTTDLDLHCLTDGYRLEQVDDVPVRETKNTFVIDANQHVTYKKDLLHSDGIRLLSSTLYVFVCLYIFS